MGQALWFLSRGTGMVALLLLTATVVIGITHSARASSRRWPRFARHAMHRNLSLLAISFVAVHIAGAIIDRYAGIRWAAAVLPFTSSYHPFWIGLGALAWDLLMATVLTSLLRHRIGLRTWRMLHLASYGLWPLALGHGLGVGGADSRLGWVLAIDAGCALAVIVALWRRLRTDDPDRDARRAVEAGLR